MAGLILAALAILLARSAWARATPASLAGTWVSSETLQALEAGLAAEVGCYLVATFEPLAIEERCGERRTEWGWLEVEERKGSVEVRDGLRRLVNRAGTPNELELTSGGELRRLYRISPEQEETVAEWAMLPPPPALEEEEAAAPQEPLVEPARAEAQSEPIIPRSRFGCAAAGGSRDAALALVIAAGALGFRSRRSRAQEG